MKIIIVFLAFLSASLGMAQTQGWHKQVSGNTSNTTSLFFLNKDTGWAASGIGLLYTSNGGDTWLPITSYTIYSQKFIDANNGLACGDSSLVRTFDGGKNWQPIQAPICGSIQIFDMDTIRLFNGTKTASSNDLGKTWVNPTVGFDMGSMYFVNGKTGYGCGRKKIWFGNFPPKKGTEGASFEYTIDGGTTWHEKYCPIQEDLHAIFAPDSEHLYVAGDNNIYYSSDAGNTWKKIFNEGGNTSVFYFLNIGRGYAAGGSEKIFFTSDTGKNWVTQNTTVTTYLNDIFFIDSLTGWASGYQGVILHTTNGGQSWVRQTLPSPLETHVSPEPFAAKTTISYSIPRAAKVSIHIYDVTGKELKVLESPGIQEAGMHSIEFDGSAYPEGVFQYRLESDGFYGMGKMTKMVF